MASAPAQRVGVLAADAVAFDASWLQPSADLAPADVELEAVRAQKALNELRAGGAACEAQQPQCAARVIAWARLSSAVVIDDDAGELSASLINASAVAIRRVASPAPSDPSARGTVVRALLHAVLFDTTPMGRVTCAVTAEQTVTVDGVACTDAALTVAAGTHAVQVSRGGERVAADVRVPADLEVAHGLVLASPVVAPPVPAVVAPAVSDVASPKPAGFGGLAVAGVVVTGVAGVVAVAAGVAAALLWPSDAAYRRGELSAADVNRGQQAAVTSALVGGVVAVVAAAVGITLVVVD